jgi:GNAT superfamily N-acetyltransferase
MTALPNTAFVRAAVADDWPQLVEMCQELEKDNAMDEVDWGLVEETLLRCLNKNGGMIGVIGPVGEVEAAVCLTFATYWYSNKVFLEEKFLYVRPAYRRTANAQALLQFARNAAKRLKVKLLIGAVSSERTKGKLEFYRRKLGEPIGGYFWIG